VSEADLSRLARWLGHEFADPALLQAALTHRSAGTPNNERLEFLGDAILNFVIAAALYERRPQAAEGDLSRLRANLVRERTLAEIAAEIDLGSYLRMGPGELQSGGFRRVSILADALEALFGAVYLDGGFEPARDLVASLYEARLSSLPDADALKDAKTRLQEWLQARGRRLPTYEVIEVSGEAHNQRFVARCALADSDRATEGEGRSRRRAEQDAAKAMLESVADDDR